jgi:hypothetical protein
MDSATTFDGWLEEAWSRHAADPAGVAARLAGEGAARAADDSQLLALVRLVHHVMGEHLRRWAEGRATVAALGAHAACGAGTRAQLPVFDASLALAGGLEDLRATLGRSDRIRANALAAGSLVGHDAARAGELLAEAMASAEAEPLDDADPACRALAVAGNNLACELEDKPGRSEAERTLMLLGARTARTWWARVGGWLEIERAEYRLSMSWLAAGDPSRALEHARACLAIVEQQGAPPLEAFFGWEAAGRAAAAAGDASGHAQALEQSRAAFEALGEGDRRWCRASLDALAAAPVAGNASPPQGETALL